MTFIRTVLGDIPSNELGMTYMHEHLIIDSAIVTRDFEHISLPNVDDAVIEVGYCREAGVRTLVDCMPMGSGGDMTKLRTVSEHGRVNIVAATGMHTRKYYDENSDYLSLDVEELANRFIQDISLGAQGTRSKTGIIKVATLGCGFTPLEERLFRAAAIAHMVTGAPIITHCEQGDGALQQIDLLVRLEVPLCHVTISHTDKTGDVGYISDILQTGVNVEFDQALRQAKDREPASAALMSEMVNRGYLEQLMLGTDGARRSLWSALGGSPGLAWLASGWPRILSIAGLSDKEISTIFIANPSRALSFRLD
jgi:5-phospho-D-xylono-1,4-lactonase